MRENEASGRKRNDEQAAEGCGISLHTPMTRALVSLVVPSLILLSACAPDDKVVFADAIWRLRCPDSTAGCFQDWDIVDVFGYDGDQDNGETIVAECNYVQIENTEVISLKIGIADAFLEVNGLTVQGSQPVGSGCRVSAVQDNTTFGGDYGTCTAAAPTEDAPCQIQTVDIITGTDDEDSLVQFDLYCEALPAPFNPTMLQADLTASDNASGPLTVKVRNCVGL